MKIVAMGDSITKGLNATIGDIECKSYAHWIADVAGGHATIHARTGATAAQVLELAQQNLDAHYDTAFVFVGVNDALAANWNPDALDAAHRELLTTAAATATRVITMTIPPWVGRMLAPRQRINQANEIIRANATRTGVEVVDLSPVNCAPAAWADLVHPTSLGQLAIADLIAEHMGLPAPTKTIEPAPLGARFWIWYRYRQAKYWARQTATRTARALRLR